MAAEIDIAHVQDFETGLAHGLLPVSGERFERAGFGGQAEKEGVSEETSLGVAEDVEFELPDAGVELRGEGRMVVGERFSGPRVLFPQDGQFAGSESDMVAVMRADHLDVVHPQRLGGAAEGESGE